MVETRLPVSLVPSVLWNISSLVTWKPASWNPPCGRWHLRAAVNGANCMRHLHTRSEDARLLGQAHARLLAAPWSGTAGLGVRTRSFSSDSQTGPWEQKSSKVSLFFKGSVHGAGPKGGCSSGLVGQSLSPCPQVALVTDTPWAPTACQVLPLIPEGEPHSQEPSKPLGILIVFNCLFYIFILHG